MEDLEYQRDEKPERRVDKAQVVAKILVVVGIIFFLFVLGFIIWVGCHVFSGFNQF
ncbi:MAG: hypothetical protein J6W42_04845 [Bacteroidaceae bacterium]|nr:hypothetical protein [Bacteroidaceae bacterium]